MATIINISGGSGSNFLKGIGFINIPAGKWEWKSTAQGDTWPGFSSNVIPLTITSSRSFSGSGTGGTNTNTVSYSYNTTTQINGTTAIAVSGTGKGGVNKSFTSGQQAQGSTSGTATAYNIWLPAFYGYDLTLIQSSITSGTVSAWLEK